MIGAIFEEERSADHESAPERVILLLLFVLVDIHAHSSNLPLPQTLFDLPATSHLLQVYNKLEELTAAASMRPPRETLMMITPFFIVSEQLVSSVESSLSTITDALLADDVIGLGHERHVERDDIALLDTSKPCA